MIGEPSRKSAGELGILKWTDELVKREGTLKVIRDKRVRETDLPDVREWRKRNGRLRKDF